MFLKEHSSATEAAKSLNKKQEQPLQKYTMEKKIEKVSLDTFGNIKINY